jgi:remodeling and spacing factor 1
MHGLALLLSLISFIYCIGNTKEAYGKESSNSSDDEEWSGKELLEGSETDSLGERLHPVKRCSRRAPAGQQNNEYTPQKFGPECEQKTEILRSNGSSSTGRKFGPVVTQV